MKRVGIVYILLLFFISSCISPYATPPVNLELEYISNIQEDTGGCIIAIIPVINLLARFLGNQSLITDSQWVANSKIALIVINDHCGNMGWVIGVPKKYQEINDYLLSANLKFKEFAKMYRQGIDSKDSSLIIKSTSLLSDAGTSLRQVANSMNILNEIIYLYR